MWKASVALGGERKQLKRLQIQLATAPREVGEAVTALGESATCRAADGDVRVHAPTRLKKSPVWLRLTGARRHPAH